MFYSLLILNPRACLVQREVEQPYEIHRTLLKAFRGQTNVIRNTDDAAGVLFRLDETRDGRPMLLVQSSGAPDWSVLPPGYLVEPPQVKERAIQLAAGQRLAFRLRANPTKRLGKSAGKDQGKRVGIYDQDEQLAWLARKGEQHGFKVLHAQVTRDAKIKQTPGPARRPAPAVAPGAGLPATDRHALTLLSVQFDGSLEVTDARLFEEAVQCGIGSAKGFGFGLLSLARAG